MISSPSTSHKQILKSTGILGGAQVITILVGIARAKIVAVLLGPTGVGILGLYNSTLELVRSGTGFGLNFSAVRDIAEAAGTHDQQRISRTIQILRRWVWGTGLLGMGILIVFCRPLSRYAFGDESNALALACLSITLLFAALSGGQLALLQGLRKIGTMARANIWGVIFGFVLSVPLYWMLGQEGIVPAILVTSVIGLGLSWYFVRGIPVQRVALGLKETLATGWGMAKLGSMMVVSGFALALTMYLVRLIISDRSGIEAVGQFQAAWNLSAMYLAAILQAMAADYFPRLSAVNTDPVAMNRLVNEQTEIALLLAGPLIVGMVSFVGLLVYVFYSGQFQAAVDILNWQLVGTLFKVLSWPMGFIMLAKARSDMVITSELVWQGSYLGSVFLLYDRVGLPITGIGFLASYIFFVIILISISRNLCGFRWSVICLRHIVVMIMLTLLAFLSSRYLYSPLRYLVGGVLTVATAGYSVLEFRKFVDLSDVIKRITRR